jgi:cell division protein FtsN
MTRDNDDRPENKNQMSQGTDSKLVDKNMRQEPQFTQFAADHEDDYEEPERDTDFASGLGVDSVEDEEEFEDTFPDEEDADLFTEDDSDSLDEPEESLADEPDAWLEKEGYLEEEEEEGGQNWPFSMIAVAILAVVLLAAGGYGVMQQRAATQDELRQLRAALATAASPADVSASRESLQELQLSYDKLAGEAEALTLENRRLADTVAGLEAQLGGQQTLPTKTPSVASATDTKAPSIQPVVAAPAAPQPAAPQPAAPQPAAPQPAAPQRITPKLTAAHTTAAASSGPWFVNFGSYAARNMAETWATRLHPGAGKVVIAASTSDGKTLYRVRVVGLADREAARKVASKLEADMRVSELWVGKE